MRKYVRLFALAVLAGAAIGQQYFGRVGLDVGDGADVFAGSAHGFIL